MRYCTFYRSSPTGEITQKTDITLEGVPLIHDFAMAGPYLNLLYSAGAVEFAARAKWIQQLE